MDKLLTKVYEYAQSHSCCFQIVQNLRTMNIL